MATSLSVGGSSRGARMKHSQRNALRAQGREHAPVQVGANLVRLALTNGVALRAASFEEGSTLLSVT